VAAEVSSFKMLLTLGLAGMISGGVLVGIYEATAPRIERNRAEALERAIYEVLPGAVSKEAWVADGDGLKRPEVEPKPGADAVYAGYDADGNRLGFAIPAAGAGFQDTIALIYGIDPARRRIVGMRVLESRETPGLGDKIIKDDHFVAEFDDLAVDPEIVALPKGTTTGEHEIDAISGATISSVAICNILNESNSRWLGRLPTGEQ